MMKILVAAFFLLSFCASVSAPAPRAAEVPGSGAVLQPSKVLISPGGASLTGTAVLPVNRDGGVPSVSVLLPDGARSVVLEVKGCRIARVTRASVPFEPTGSVSSEGRDIRARLAELNGRLAFLDARVRELVKTPDGGNAEKLFQDREQLKLQINDLKALEKKYQDGPHTGLLVTAALAGSVSEDRVTVSCSYLLPGCSWNPVYSADCAPGKDGKGTLSVRLEAVVRQFSGIDWTDCDVTLVSKSAEAADLPPLRTWIIGDSGYGGAPMRASMNLMAREDSVGSAPEEAEAKTAPPVRQDSQGSYVTWKPAMKGLQEGESRILLAEAGWQEDLTWVARPLNADARVFLCAEHVLAPGEIWPRGEMDMSVDGVSVGRGDFNPRLGRVRFSFGPDPRVRLTAVTEPRKSGSEGLIAQKKVWEWAWTYTVRNDRETGVTVRVERPVPQSADKDVSVEYTGKPVPQEDKDEKKLVWTLGLKPHSEASVSHSVRVTAPKDSDVSPVAP